MLGAIIGDTVGSVYEFNNTKDVNFPLFSSRSIYTDDSLMALAVSLGGDSDTLACITGGIAEAFYKRIPQEMVDQTLSKLPEQLRDILKSFASASFYKQQYPINK